MGLKIFNKYLIFFIICFFLNPIISNAECSYERQAELSKIASNVQIAYSYENDMGNPVFSVNIINITNDIYVLEHLKVILIIQKEQPLILKYIQMILLATVKSY